MTQRPPAKSNNGYGFWDALRDLQWQSLVMIFQQHHALSPDILDDGLDVRKLLVEFATEVFAVPDVGQRLEDTSYTLFGLILSNMAGLDGINDVSGLVTSPPRRHLQIKPRVDGIM